MTCASGTHRTLRLVESEPTWHPPEREVLWEGPLPHARPADRCEPWLLSDALAAGLLDAADAAWVEPSLAAGVLVQRRLALIDLREVGLEPDEHALDAEARLAGPCVALTEPNRAYLRALSGAGYSAPARPRELQLQLPMRFSERILAYGLAELLDEFPLDSALQWERAALCVGRTMGEWALLAGASAAQPPRPSARLSRSASAAAAADGP